MQIRFPVDPLVSLVALACLLLSSCSRPAPPQEEQPTRQGSPASPGSPEAPQSLAALEDAPAADRADAPVADVPMLTVEVRPRSKRPPSASEVSDSDGIWVVDPTSYDVSDFKERSAALGSRSAWELVEEFGRFLGPIELDESGAGSAEIPAPHRRATVHVRAGGLAGRRVARHAKGGRLEVVLYGPVTRSIAMTALEVSGAPAAGVEVLEAPEDDATQPGVSDWARSRRADESGRFTIVPEAGESLIVPNVLGIRNVSPLKDGGTLRLPPHGSVEFDFGDASVKGTLTLRARGARWNGYRQLRLDSTSRLRAGWIGLDHKMRLSGVLDAGSVDVDFEGPTAHGEVIRINVRPVGFRRVTARLVDTSGEPMSGYRTTIEIDRSRVFDVAASDEQGRIDLELEMDDTIATEGFPVLVHGWRSAKERFRGPFGRAAIPRVAPNGDVDLGDIVLDEQPLLVAGRVVSADGSPAARATVTWDIRRRQDPNAFVGTLGRARPSNGYRTPRIARTDAEGRFEFRSIEDESFGGQVDLWVSARGRRTKQAPSEQVSFEPGERNVILSLRDSGALIYEAPEIPKSTINRLRARLVPADGSPPRALGLIKGGLVSGIAEGTYRAEVSLDDSVIHTIDDIVVTGGGTTKDARLLPIDVSSVLRIRSARFVREDGSPVSPVQLGYRGEGDWTVQEIGTPDGVMTWIELVDGSMPATANAPAGAPVLLKDVTEGQEVVLPGPQRIELRFDDPDVAHMAFSVYRAGGDLPPFQSTYQTDATGVASLRLPGPGSYGMWVANSGGPFGDNDSPWNGRRLEVAEGTRSIVLSPK